MRPVPIVLLLALLLPTVWAGTGFSGEKDIRLSCVAGVRTNPLSPWCDVLTTIPSEGATTATVTITWTPTNADFQTIRLKAFAATCADPATERNCRSLESTALTVRGESPQTVTVTVPAQANAFCFIITPACDPRAPCLPWGLQTYHAEYSGQV